jgi:hypothetical protein
MRLLATIINSRNRLLIGLLRRLWTIDFSVWFFFCIFLFLFFFLLLSFGV